MDLNLTAEELTFRDELRAWLASNVPKDWSDWREKPMEESFPYLRAWQRKLQEGRWAAAEQQSNILGRKGSRRGAADGQLSRSRSHRPHDHRLWNRSAKKTLHSKNSERRRNLVPGVLRASRGLRP